MMLYLFSAPLNDFYASFYKLKPTVVALWGFYSWVDKMIKFRAGYVRNSSIDAMVL